MLGNHYLVGLTVPKDLDKARYWYAAAAKQGCVFSKVAREVLDSVSQRPEDAVTEVSAKVPESAEGLHSGCVNCHCWLPNCA